ncbi:GATA transcription factor 9 [Heracleum sosnowskyi]|uniref:GATA transcription factor 9 n=1 Tax=Heracleum sosnowskyi TaxID=360622 RepID=A0AAD8IW40_9APIA|nr:GATA transcription factor 9 [Heracleum sosnowskyi]
MDLSRKISVPGYRSSEYELEQLFSPCSKLGSLDDMLSSNSMEGDRNSEWLSIYVEDCFSSSGNCFPPATLTPQIVETTTSSCSGSTIIPKTEAAEEANLKPLQSVEPQKNSKSSILHKFAIPGRARSKRTRGPIGNKSRRITSQFTSWSHHLQMTNSDPPLLEQAYWLADSELILPKKEEMNEKTKQPQKPKIEEEKEGNNVNTLMMEMEKEEEIWGSLEDNNGQQQARRCTHCLSQKTPQWRGGPLGPKTLCNACGVRYKSGRLLPEYRPAKSPTFVSYKHSNSHKKVLEMRTMSHLSSNSFFH